MRIQHKNVEGGAVAARRERGRAGVARGRADDRHLLAAPRQRGIEQPPNQLQRQILEGKRRAVKQLQQPQPLVQLHERRHGGMAERAVGAPGQPRQFLARECLAGKERHDLRRQLGIGPPGKAGQLRCAQFRQGFRHKQPAIIREAGEQGLLEGVGGRRGPGIAGTEIAHPLKV